MPSEQGFIVEFLMCVDPRAYVVSSRLSLFSPSFRGVFLSISSQLATAAEGMDVDGGAAAAAAAGMTDAVLAALTAKAQELTKTRKKRPVPPTLATAADIGSYAEKASVAPHATKTPGITCIDLHPTLPLTVSGGADKTACVFDHAKGQSVATLSSHTKKVTSCTFHRSKQGLVLTGSADKTVRLWDASSGDGAAKATIEGFGGEVSGVSVHPTGDYAAVSGKDGSWSFASLNYATVLEKVGACLGVKVMTYLCIYFDHLKILFPVIHEELFEVHDLTFPLFFSFLT